MVDVAVIRQRFFLMVNVVSICLGIVASYTHRFKVFTASWHVADPVPPQFATSALLAGRLVGIVFSIRVYCQQFFFFLALLVDAQMGAETFL